MNGDADSLSNYFPILKSLHTNSGWVGLKCARQGLRKIALSGFHIHSDKMVSEKPIIAYAKFHRGAPSEIGYTRCYHHSFQEVN
jgi:hypothetical protein